MRVGFIVAFLIALAAAGADKPASRPATRPATATSPAEPLASTPKEALRSLNLAQRDGDAAAVRSLFVTDDEDGAKLISAMADYSAALVALHTAAAKAYGADGANLVTGDINAQSSDGLAAIDKAEVAVTDDKAAVTYAGAKDAPVRLVKVKGRWKLPLSQLLDGADIAAKKQRLAELTHQAHVANDMAKDLINGKYKEGPSRAAAVWRSRLLETPKPGSTTNSREK